MIHKKVNHLWMALVVLVFMIMFTSYVFMSILLFIMFKLDWLRMGHFNIVWLMLLIVLTSIIIGTVITALSSRKILHPISSLNEATKEVAKGNFSVELYENYKIEELGEMAKNFNKMVQELNGIETLRNDFVVNVSHEFKTPIAAIDGYATLMQAPNLTEDERKEFTRMIMLSTRQLSTLTNHILKLSKLENQEIITEKETFDLDEQIRQAILLLEPHWSSKQMNLDIRLETVCFYGNEELLMQVWVNLLNNAVKFSNVGGDLSIVLTAVDDKITVDITDTGVGMTRDVQKHIFEKFYQGDKSRAAEGNGLGLPLVRRIIDLCGGKIRVKSELGEGSLFTVVLPQDRA